MSEDSSRILKIMLNILIPAAGVLLVCLLGPWLLKFFMPFVIGWIIAMIANPLVRFLEKHLKIVRRHSSVVIVVLVLALVIGALYLVCSRLFLETVGLIRDLPEMVEALKGEIAGALSRISRFVQILPQGVRDWFERLNDDLGSAIGELLQGIATPTMTAAGNVARAVPSALVYSIVTILSAYFFIVEREQILAGMRKFIPASVWDYFHFLKNDMLKLLGGYFLAQFRIMFVVAVILAIGFLILGVNYGVIWAVLIALLDFLPLFGTGTALFPWALVKLLSGEWPFAAGLVFLYLLTQVVRQVIQPKIVGDSLGVPPLATLFLLYIGFKIRGISGMILAVPLGILAINLYEYGVFNSFLENIKLLAGEINRFRKSL